MGRGQPAAVLRRVREPAQDQLPQHCKGCATGVCVRRCTCALHDGEQVCPCHSVDGQMVQLQPHTGAAVAAREADLGRRPEGQKAAPHSLWGSAQLGSESVGKGRQRAHRGPLPLAAGRARLGTPLPAKRPGTWTAGWRCAPTARAWHPVGTCRRVHLPQPASSRLPCCRRGCGRRLPAAPSPAPQHAAILELQLRLQLHQQGKQMLAGSARICFAPSEMEGACMRACSHGPA